MKIVFLDTNILLDVMLHREEFLPDAVRLWADCEEGRIRGVISAITLNNLHFIMRKRVGSIKALDYVRHALNVFAVEPLDDTILRLAVDMPCKDFEDAIQTFSAVHAKAQCIVTRNPSHFSHHYLPIITPREYWDIHH
jgi:predicted nucleic acid-binding protein